MSAPRPGWNGIPRIPRLKSNKNLFGVFLQKLPLSALTNNPTWIIDPIDGTMNFVHGNPLVVTSVGLAINKKLVLGIINAPCIDKCYSAIKGKGAFLNGEQKLSVSRYTRQSSLLNFFMFSHFTSFKKHTSHQQQKCA